MLGTTIATTHITTPSTATSTSATSTTTKNTTPNFLINPGGELGTLSPWIPTSGIAPIVDRGTANGNNITPYNGSYAFFGGYGGGSLRQRITLNNTFSPVQLDSGLLYASISFWERTWDQSSTDTGQVSLKFLSGTNTTISTVTTGPISCVPSWCRVARNWSLPVGTRSIEYMMIFVANNGNNADAWIDDNTLMIF